MEVIIVYVAIAVALFVAAFVAKRRFGLLGLALAAGFLLSDIWGYNIGLLVNGLGAPPGPLTSAITLSALVLLPAGVLMFHGYVYKGLISRVTGAILFTVLALAFLVEPIGHVLAPQGIGAEVYNWLADNNSAIIAAGISVAVLDLFFTKPAGMNDKRRRR